MRRGRAEGEAKTMRLEAKAQQQERKEKWGWGVGLRSHKTTQHKGRKKICVCGGLVVETVLTEKKRKGSLATLHARTCESSFHLCDIYVTEF